mgnify:CR=1 FL=1
MNQKVLVQIQKDSNGKEYYAYSKFTNKGHVMLVTGKTVVVNIENEPKYTFKLTKTVEGTGEVIKGVRFRIYGKIYFADDTVKVYDSKNKLISTLLSDSKGNVVIKNLGSDNYKLEVSYSTYEPIILDDIDFTKKSGTHHQMGADFFM